MTKRGWLLAAAAGAFCFPAAAQDMGAAADADEAETGNRDVITVEAARRETPAEALPNTVRLIDREELAQQLAVSTSLLDVIGTRVPSTAPTRQKLTGAGESFRGREPLYLIDGVPQSNPLRNGARDGFTIDPAVIERIEVLYGANAIQGVGATGGVINYVTLKPTRENRWQSRVEAGITADDGFNGDGYTYRGAATVLRDFGAVDAVVSAAVERRGAFYDAEGRRIGLDTVQGDIQDSLSTNFFAKLGYEPDDLTRLQVTANFFDLDGDGDYVSIDGDRDAGVPVIAVRGEAEGIPPENKVRTISLDFSRDEVFGGKLSAQGFYQDFEAVYGGGVFATFQDPAIDPTGQLFDQSANNSEKLGLKLTYAHTDLGIEGLGVIGGLDILRDLTFQELAQTGRNWVPETTFVSFAPFIQFDQAFFDGRATLSAGLRNEFAKVKVDDFETLAFYGPQQVAGGEPDFSELLFNAGGTFEVVEGFTLYAAYSEGFTMPDVGRVLRGISSPGVDVDDLVDVEPIIADNIETGLTVAAGPFSGNVSYFWSNSDLGQRLSANVDGIFEVNRERTEIEGVEFALEFAPTNGFAVGANFAALEGRFDSDEDGEVDSDLGGSNISPDRLNVYVEASPVDRLFLRAQTSSFFDRAFDDAGTATDFEGYTLVDFLVGYDLGERLGRLDFGIQNLFDADYFTYYSQSGTTLDSRYFAGRGRTLTLRWSASY